MEHKKIILLFSGGRDSSLLLQLAKNLKYDIHCLMFDYGQIHKEELNFAKKICSQERISFDLIRITLPIRSNLLEEVQTYENVSQYHVPSRNAIFVTIAAGVAESKSYNTIWLGANYDDRENQFPDWYQEWVFQINKLLAINGSVPIKIEAPLIGMTSNLITAISKQFFNINQNQIFSGYGTNK